MEEESKFVRDDILPKMSLLRIAADEAEVLCPADIWPYPSYGELLFGVK